MGRLTARTADGLVFLKKERDKDCRHICDKNASCDDCHLYAVKRKLADYEDAEEQGLLLRLPCSIGDTVYYINPRTNNIESTVILRYWILGFKNFVIDRNEMKCSFSQFGKKVFLTREEAEAKLAEMQKG